MAKYENHKTEQSPDAWYEGIRLWSKEAKSRKSNIVLPNTVVELLITSLGESFGYIKKFLHAPFAKFKH